MIIWQERFESSGGKLDFMNAISSLICDATGLNSFYESASVIKITLSS